MFAVLPSLALAATLSMPGQPQQRDPKLMTSQNQPTTLSRFLGKPTILLYGGRNTQHLNDAFDHELVVRLEQRRPQPNISVIPVADLHDVNYWPVRNVALAKVHEVEREHHL